MGCNIFLYGQRVTGYYCHDIMYIVCIIFICCITYVGHFMMNIVYSIATQVALSRFYSK